MNIMVGTLKNFVFLFFCLNAISSFAQEPNNELTPWQALFEIKKDLTTQLSLNQLNTNRDDGTIRITEDVIEIIENDLSKINEDEEISRMDIRNLNLVDFLMVARDLRFSNTFLMYLASKLPPEPATCRVISKELQPSGCRP